jgi:hypothetical protein
MATYDINAGVIHCNRPIIDEIETTVGHVLNAHDGVMQCVLNVDVRNRSLKLANTLQEIVVIKEIL